MLSFQSLACVRRIADALMALQQYGSGDYIGWEMTFPCALSDAVEELKKVASRMENDLDKWKKEIQEKRDEFYELNYYNHTAAAATQRGAGETEGARRGSGEATCNGSLTECLERGVC